jgi:peroxiredoxin
LLRNDRRWRLALALVPGLSLASCVTQQRGQILEARIAKLEAGAGGDAAERLDGLERRGEVARVEAGRLERRLAKLEAALAAKDGTPPPPAVKPADAVLAGAHEGSYWDPFQRKFAAELVTLYTTNQLPTVASNITNDDPETQKPFKPRDPGKKGIDGENLVGNPLARTRFLASTGETFDVKDYVGKKNVVLVVLRGLDNGRVCLGCSTQTLSISQSLDEFEKRDAVVFLIYPGAASSVPKFLDAVRDLGGTLTNLSLEILLDVDLAVVKEFKIEGRLAKPTTVILDKKGVCRFAHVGQSRSDRPTVPQMLGVLDQIKAEDK